MDDDFQRLASVQGRTFEQTVRGCLQFAGWTHVSDAPIYVLGHEVDIVATRPDGVECLIECKGSWRGSVPGCRKADTVKKAVGVAACLRAEGERRPYYLVTSHLPQGDVVAARMLKIAVREGWFTAVMLHTDIA